MQPEARHGTSRPRYREPRQRRAARELLGRGSNGIVYRSARHRGGACLACFRPRLVLNVRQGAHFAYRWEGRPEPTIRELRAEGPGA